MAEIRPFPAPSVKPLRESVAPKYAREEHPAPKPCKYCVYDQTRERFVASDIEAVSGSEAGIEARLRELRPGSGAIWIVPFQGISPMSLRFPVDLVFLSGDRAVLETVESFPMAGVGALSAQAASALVLPADSLAQGEIRPGDRLAICPPEEMKQYLQRLQEEVKAPQAAPMAGSTGATAAAIPKAVAMPPQAKEQPVLPQNGPQPWKKEAPRSWWKRLLLGDPVDPRRSAREPLPGLVAYFFTGGTPMEQPVQDISNSGLYILTTERWFKGTIVQLTLTDRHDRRVERSITVNARVVRLGDDGVG